MSKEGQKKQPYIPLYIGDWEQDTNCLSLQAEAAWLKIIFKMWKNGKSGKFKTSTNALQNLWKTDTKGVQNIIYELNLNEVCDFDPPYEKAMDGGDILIFINRRMAKEAKISGIRSEAVQNRYKDDTNPVQPLDSDNENDTIVLNKLNVPFEDFWNLYEKKVGSREKLEKKWAALKDGERLLVMNHLPGYKEDRPDKKYRKDPATYLNNKSWNDERISNNGTYNKSTPSANGHGKRGTSTARVEGLSKF